MNARGYAYTALKQTWTRQLGWSQYAAAQKYGYYPTLSEYTQRGLASFDALLDASYDMDEVQELVNYVIRDLSQSIATEWKGHFWYPTNSEGKQETTIKHDVILDQPLPQSEDTLGSQLGEEEKGYDEFIDADLMVHRLRAIRECISSDDMDTLLVYLEGANFVEATGSNAEAGRFAKRIRYACRDLKEEVMFA